MIWIIAGLAVLAAGLAVAMAMQARARHADSLALIAAKQLLTDAIVVAATREATLVKERDEAIKRAGKLAAEVADALQRIAVVSAERDELAQKLAKAVMARLAEMPVSEDGAAVVNSMFAEPLPGKEPKS